MGNTGLSAEFILKNVKSKYKDKLHIKPVLLSPLDMKANKDLG